MNILVTGTEGYIGSVLAPFLIRRGHHVVGLDTGFYREGLLMAPRDPMLPACINKDLRHITEDDLDGFDAVVHLAEMSNDPLGQQNPAVTYAINHRGTVALAKKCLKSKVSRFVYTSSCSVYGIGAGEFKDERSRPQPQTAYALCKVLVEQDLSALASDSFSPTFLRNATAYGPSPRMRFDLVLNNLAGLAWTTKEIHMVSDGTPWRPVVHVRDIAYAIACTLEAPVAAVHNEVFNVGSTTENYQVRDLAQIVAEVFPDCQVTSGSMDGDNRSYRVCFDKICEKLPKFYCAHTAEEGARELLQVFNRIRMSPGVFEFRPYTRLKQLQYLLQSGQIDEEFYWTEKSPLSSEDPQEATPTVRRVAV
jgi:nucleoside-diphosphate-sugar epimerase